MAGVIKTCQDTSALQDGTTLLPTFDESRGKELCSPHLFGSKGAGVEPVPVPRTFEAEPRVGASPSWKGPWQCSQDESQARETASLP